MGLIQDIKNLPSATWSMTRAAGATAKSLATTGSMSEAIDAMINVSADRVADKVNELRVKHPDATPGELARIVTNDFRSHAAAASGLAGASAAMPGLGTTAGLVLSSTQLLAFASQAGYYVMTMASIYGIPIDDIDKRRLLVLTSLLGDEGVKIASDQAGFSTVTALKGYATDLQRKTIRKINRTLVKRVSQRAAGRGILATAGRIMPFGIGAAFGWYIGSSMAGGVIEGVKHALGPVPKEFAAPIEVEITVDGEVSPSEAE